MTPKGLILLSQPGQLAITPAEMTDALPDALKTLPRHTAEIDLTQVTKEATDLQDWGKARRMVEQQVRDRLKPLQDKYPDSSIVYFGSAPVPLAVYLGFLIETWQQVDVIPHHHARRAWGWVDDSAAPAPRIAPVNLPDYKDRTQGEAIVRVSTSHPVDPALTRLVVPEPVIAEIDISLEHPAEDAFTSLDQMREVAQEFRKALDLIGDNFPGVQRVHLFASVQPGIALLLGAQISKTMHPPIQTYQYLRHADSPPYHVPAVLINKPPPPEPVPLTPQQEAQAARDRENLKQDIDRMKGFATLELKHPDSPWISHILPDSDNHPEFVGRWLDLPSLSDTPLRHTDVDIATRIVEDSFRLDGSNQWQIDDHWLAGLARRLPEEKQRQRALRMFVLHELMHRGPQGLTTTLTRGIGRFPKVLEAADYHADVWGMLYEYALAGVQSPSEVADPRKFFMELIGIATSTMWAFVEDGPPLRRIQVRRLNRYLIWYWQYLLIERLTAKGQQVTLDQVLTILAQQPLIELAGPPVVASNERVFFALDAAQMATPELAVYHGGRLYRYGSRIDFPIDGLLEGVRQRDGDKIIAILRAAVEQTAR